MGISPRFSLQGRVALVTGGGRGLGFEIARAFDDADILRLVGTDLLAAVSLSREAAEIMKAQGHGRLIAVTSIIGDMALPGDAVYPVAKQGLTGLMRSMAVEYGPHGVTSNAIAPACSRPRPTPPWRRIPT